MWDFRELDVVEALQWFYIKKLFKLPSYTPIAHFVHENMRYYIICAHHQIASQIYSQSYQYATEQTFLHSITIHHQKENILVFITG